MKMEINIIKKYIKTPEAVTAMLVIISGIIVHMFCLVNPMHNFDDMYMQPYGYGTDLTSGRWSLMYIGSRVTSWLGGYNLPLINGLVFIFCIAISAALLVSIFKIKNYIIAALIGVSLITFPTATATLFYTFTAPYYGLAILFAVLAVWVLPKRKYLGLLCSVLLTALSIGIYQAYFPITVSICVLLIIKRALIDDVTPLQIIKDSLYKCFALTLGMICYFAGLKLTLDKYDRVLSEYQGIDKMGKIPLIKIPELIWKALRSFCLFPAEDYCDLAQIKILKVAYYVIFAIILGMIIFIIINKRKKTGMIALISLLCIIYPIAINLIVIMCPDSAIYVMMVYSFVLVLCTPLILVDALPEINHNILKYIKPIVIRIAAILVLAVVCCNSYLANTNYTSLYYATRQAENYFNGLIIQVRMTDGYDADKKWALIGDINDPLLQGSWKNTPRYGGNTIVQEIVNNYARNTFISTYIGYSVPIAGADDLDAVKNTDEFINMPCWPEEGSIMVIDDIIVVKFSEE